MMDPQIHTLKPPTADDPVLAEIVRRLVDVYRPERIYLFGSTARGDAGPDSDYDLMVILPDEAPLHLRRGIRAQRPVAAPNRLRTLPPTPPLAVPFCASSAKGYRALRGTGVAADLHVWPLRDFHRQLHLKASFPSTVAREGKLLYGA